MAEQLRPATRACDEVLELHSSYFCCVHPASWQVAKATLDVLVCSGDGLQQFPNHSPQNGLVPPAVVNSAPVSFFLSSSKCRSARLSLRGTRIDFVQSSSLPASPRLHRWPSSLCHPGPFLAIRRCNLPLSGRPSFIHSAYISLLSLPFA